MFQNCRFFLLYCIIGMLILSACGTPFRIIEIQKSEESTYAFAQTEPSIAIDPNDPMVMVAGTVMNDYYFSNNGGKKWHSSVLKSPFGVNGDPVLHISQNGRIYYFHLSNPENGHRLDRIACAHSDFYNGKSWEYSATAVNSTKVQDKPWVAECPVTGNLYLTWTQFDAYKSPDPKDSSFIFFAKSTDEGKTWSNPIRISKLGGDCMDGNQTVEGAVPAVDNQGNLFVVWTGPHGLRMNYSMDEGETWLEEELFVTDHPGGWSFDVPGIYRCNGLPIIKIDRSKGEQRGRIYINWSDQSNGENQTDVWLVHSDDQGKTWTAPKRVNQNKEASHQFFTWMDIDQASGYLYFVYYDRRNHPDNFTDVFLAASFDGGETFADMKISKEAFLPSENIFFGDYTNIAAVKGVIRPIWTTMHFGKIGLNTALINERKLKRKLK